MHYCALKGDKGKRLYVLSQIYKFFPRMLLSVNSFQKLIFYVSLFIAKNHILTGDLDHKM